MLRSKAPLSMMEQLVMLLVFALAAALCLQAFATADRLSKGGEDRDRAAALGQAAAEAVRHSGGEFFSVYYDRDWDTPANHEDRAYCLRAEPVPAGLTGLGKARISVSELETQTVLFEVETAWQEVRAYG